MNYLVSKFATCQDSISSARASRHPVRWVHLTLVAVGMLGLTGSAGAQEAGATDEEAEMPHPFYTHMGMPEGVGNFNLRLLGSVTNVDGETEGDVGFHLETGLTRLIGLHLRNDRVLNNPHTELMVQFAALTSADGMSGIGPIVEFEFPTRADAGRRINTLVGFTSTLSGRRAVFNQVLHYSPREDVVEGSAAVVFAAGRGVFPVVEVLGEGAPGEPTVLNLLAGVKVRVREWISLGLAVQLPVTSGREFSSQVPFGPDVEWVW